MYSPVHQQQQQHLEVPLTTMASPPSGVIGYYAPSPAGSYDSGVNMSPESNHSAEEAFGYMQHHQHQQQVVYQQPSPPYQYDCEYPYQQQQQQQQQQIAQPGGHPGAAPQPTAVVAKSKTDKCLVPKKGNQKPRQTSVTKKPRAGKDSKTGKAGGARGASKSQGVTVRQMLEQKRQERQRLKEVRNGHDPKHVVPSAKPKQQPQQQRIVQRKPGCFSPPQQMYREPQPILYQQQQQSYLNYQLPASPPASTTAASPVSSVASGYDTAGTLPYAEDASLDGIEKDDLIHSPQTVNPPAENDTEELDDLFKNLVDGDSFHLTPEFENMRDALLSGDNDRFRQVVDSSDSLKTMLALDEVDNHGNKLIMYAARMGNVAALQTLLTIKPELRQVDPLRPEQNLFHWAARHANADVMKFLVTFMRGNPSALFKLVNAEMSGGETPLHEACRRGDVGVIRALLHARASLLTEDYSGTTPLQLAVRTGEYGCVRCIVDFLAAGSDRKNIGELVNAADNRRCSALHMAAELSRDQQRFAHAHSIIELLLHVGADPFALNCYKQTPLQLCLPNSHSYYVLAGATQQHQQQPTPLQEGLVPQQFHGAAAVMFTGQ